MRDIWLLSLPPRALALMIAMFSVSGYAGIFLGTWALPVVFTVVFSDCHQLSEIGISHYGFALTPSWLEKEGGFFTANRVWGGAGILVAILCMRYTLNWADRFWRFLVLEKLHWATVDDLARFDKREK
jgi:hypothetical protein